MRSTQDCGHLDHAMNDLPTDLVRRNRVTVGLALAVVAAALASLYVVRERDDHDARDEPGLVQGTVTLVGPTPDTEDFDCGTGLISGCPGGGAFAIDGPGPVADAFVYLLLAPESATHPASGDPNALGPGWEDTERWQYVSPSSINPAGVLRYDERGISPKTLILENGNLLAITNDSGAHNAFLRDDGEILTVRALPGPWTIADAVPSNSVVSVCCELHACEHAFVLSLPHGFAAVTDRQGRFAITGVPAGTHTVVAWHPHLGRWEHPVQVSSTGTVVSIEYAP